MKNALFATVMLFSAATTVQAASISLDSTVNLPSNLNLPSFNFHPQGLGYDTATGELLYAQQGSQSIQRSDTSGVATGSEILSGFSKYVTGVAADATNYYYSDYTGNSGGPDLYARNKTTGATTQITSETAAFGGYPIDVRDGKLYRTENSTTYSWSNLDQIRVSSIGSADTIEQTVSLQTTSGIADIGVDSVNNEVWVLDYSFSASIRRFDLSDGSLLDVFDVAVDGRDAGLTYANGKLYLYDWVNGGTGTLSTYSVSGVSGNVPLPASSLLLLGGLASLAGLRRRKQAT